MPQFIELLCKIQPYFLNFSSSTMKKKNGEFLTKPLHQGSMITESSKSEENINEGEMT